MENPKQQNNEYTKQNIQTIIDAALKVAAKSGATDSQAFADDETGFAVTVRNGELETVEYHQSRNFSITVYFGNRIGSASTTDFSMSSVQETVKKACTIARATNEDPFAKLPQQELFAHHYPELQLYHPWPISTEKAIEMALSCDEIARQQNPLIKQSEETSVSTFESYKVYGNSKGFNGECSSTAHSLSCALLAEKNGEKQRDGDYTVARDPEDLMDFTWIARRAAQNTIARIGSKKIKTQTCPIIFLPQMAKSLLKSFVAAASGGNIYRKHSFLLDQLGKAIFHSDINIYQQPHLLKMMGSAPFDQEGVQTKNHYYVQNGILESYFLSDYSARQLGMQTTGNAGGVFNMLIQHQKTMRQDQLIQEMGTGFIVTELIGQGINIVTGDYSRGAAGFWVEHGEIQFPVEEVTISGNLQDMFKKIMAIGNDVDTQGSIHSGSIWIDKMTIAGL